MFSISPESPVRERLAYPLRVHVYSWFKKTYMYVNNHTLACCVNTTSLSRSVVLNAGTRASRYPFGHMLLRSQCLRFKQVRRPCYDLCVFLRTLHIASIVSSHLTSNSKAPLEINYHSTKSSSILNNNYFVYSCTYTLVYSQIQDKQYVFFFGIYV